MSKYKQDGVAGVWSESSVASVVFGSNVHRISIVTISNQKHKTNTLYLFALTSITLNNGAKY
ncbi:hypothetical protein V1477_013978 [Vespula maculifrons]|uniref:Uncharacterized protein n=1 Tax=Vespula maculifrons TaxID=7453 RepID=A0ABD2BLT7_VESMC